MSEENNKSTSEESTEKKSALETGEHQKNDVKADSQM